MPSYDLENDSRRQPITDLYLKLKHELIHKTPLFTIRYEMLHFEMYLEYHSFLYNFHYIRY